MTQPIDPMPVPQQLSASMQHLILIDQKIEKLEAARRETIDQLAANASRLSLEPTDALAFYEFMLERSIRGRGDIVSAMGWHPNQLREWSRTGLPPRGFPCVYLLLDGLDVVYVGRSRHVRSRIKRHRTGKEGQWDRHEVFICDSEDHAKDLEAVLIRQHRPPLNKAVPSRVVAA